MPWCRVRQYFDSSADTANIFFCPQVSWWFYQKTQTGAESTHYSRLLCKTAHLITFCWDAVPWQTWFKACRRNMKCASGRDLSPKGCCVPAVLILRVTGAYLGYFSLATNPWPSGQNIESENVLKLRNFRILYMCSPSLLSIRVISTMTNTQKQPG